MFVWFCIKTFCFFPSPSFSSLFFFGSRMRWMQAMNGLAWRTIPNYVHIVYYLVSCATELNVFNDILIRFDTRVCSMRYTV